jgi:hypothetical protein
LAPVTWPLEVSSVFAGSREGETLQPIYFRLGRLSARNGLRDGSVNSSGAVCG